MDWCIDGRRAGALDALVDAVGHHLGRRAVAHDGDPMLVVRDALTTVLQDSPTLWVRLTWAELQPALDVRPLLDADAALPGDPLAPGLTSAPGEAARHDELTGTPLRQHLPLNRPEEIATGPLRVGRWAGAAPEWPAATAALLAQASAAGRSVPEAAGEAGAAGAPVALGAGGGSGTAALPDALDAFLRFHRDAGGDPWVVRVDDDTALVANRRCPFGAAVAGAPELCRSTSALLGTVVSRAAGRVTDVVVDESLALGDAQCLLAVTLGTDARAPTAQRYLPGPDEAPAERTMRLTFSLQIPSDGADVHTTRRMVRAQLEALDTHPDDCDDIALALGEACSNVIEHAGAGGGYDVVVSVLGGICEVRVVDPGQGFEQALAAIRPAEHDAEGGRGLAIMHAVMDEVRFSTVPARGTTVRLVKRLRFLDAPAAGACGANGPATADDHGVEGHGVEGHGVEGRSPVAGADRRATRRVRPLRGAPPVRTAAPEPTVEPSIEPREPGVEPAASADPTVTAAADPDVCD